MTLLVELGAENIQSDMPLTPSLTPPPLSFIAAL